MTTFSALLDNKPRAPGIFPGGVFYAARIYTGTPRNAPQAASQRPTIKKTPAINRGIFTRVFSEPLSARVRGVIVSWYKHTRPRFSQLRRPAARPGYHYLLYGPGFSASRGDFAGFLGNIGIFVSIWEY